MKKPLRIFLLFIFLVTVKFTLAQQYNFKYFTIEEGLPQSTVYEIFQDSKGYLWFGTEGGGICRFDGRAFNTYSKKSGLAGNVVRSILEDNSGNLWIGTDEGISIFNGIDFRNIDQESGLSSNVVVTLFLDSENIIWAGTAGDKGGLNKIFLNKNDLVEIEYFTVDNGLTSNIIFGIYQDNFKRLWLGTFGGGINILDPDTNIKPVHFTTNNGFPSNHILTLSGRNNELWAGTYDRGAVKINIHENLEKSSFEIFDTQKGLNDNRVWNILSENGNVWLCTNQGGINKLSKGNIKYITTKNGLPGDQVLKAFKDLYGNTWFSIFDGGICLFRDEKFIRITKKDGLINDNIHDVKNTSDSTFWLSTDGNGLVRLKIENDYLKFENFTKKNGLPGNNIISTCFDNKNNLWIATKNGLSKYADKKFINFSEHDGLLNNELNCLLVDSKNIVWCGTKKGISIYDGIGFKNPGTKGLLNNHEIQTIIEDKSGNIWFGTLGDLAKIHTDTITTYKNVVLTTFDEVEGLYFRKVHSLAEDYLGNIWIGTFGGGIYKLDVNTKDSLPVKLIATDSILSSNNIYSLLFFNDTILIVGTDKGFDKLILDRSQNIIKHSKYGKNEGFTGVENNTNAITKAGNKIYFGTKNGLTIYSPALDSLNIIAPGIHIIDLKLFFEDVNWKSKSERIIPWFNLPDELELPYKSKHLSFYFAGLLYQYPEKVKYSYILEGLETNWSPPRFENEAIYPGIPPGEYKFKVIAANENGIWNKKPASFEFIIHPPFWQTTWFYLICIAVAIFLIIIYIKYRERKLRRERDRLERLVKERTREVVKKKEEIQEKNVVLEQQKEEITAQRDEIESQRDIVMEQKKEIVDSIEYASLIQTAAIPSEDIILGEFSEHFVLYKPRDIVSGDFFWFGKNQETNIVIAADCTGHGVPGAFMSMMGISLLNKIVNEKKITSPEKILNSLRENIIVSLKQTGSAQESKDGMDMVVLSFNRNSNLLQCAGANNPLYLIRKSPIDGKVKFEDIAEKYQIPFKKVTDEDSDFELFDIKGNKMPVAIYVKMDSFEKHEIELEKDDTLYIFSDGYVDQFGGPKRKKFMSKKFKHLLISIQDKPLNIQKDILNKTIEDWKGINHQVDDILVIGIRI